MKWLRLVLAASIGLAIVGSVLGCAGDEDSERPLKPDQVESLLRHTPYRTTYVGEVALPSSTATSATEARYIGPHHTKLIVTVVTYDDGDGAPRAAPVPKFGTYYEIGGVGYVYNSNIGVFKSDSNLQYNTRIEMDNTVEQKLCRATTGKPCAV